MAVNHSSSSTQSLPPPSHSPPSFTSSDRTKASPNGAPPALMHSSGLTSGSLLQISLLQNISCVFNRPRCDFLHSCKHQSKAWSFPVHAMQPMCTQRGTDPSKTFQLCTPLVDSTLPIGVLQRGSLPTSVHPASSIPPLSEGLTLMAHITSGFGAQPSAQDTGGQGAGSRREIQTFIQILFCFLQGKQTRVSKRT